MGLAYESTGPEDAKYLVVWMHGLGADGFDFLPIVEALQLPADTSVRFVFPHAPTLSVTVNQGMVMRAWFDIVSMDFKDRADVSGLLNSVQAVEALIDEITENMAIPPRLILAGFSQGGVVALATALQSKRDIAGILALSTYLPEQLRVIPENNAINGPIFMAHGEHDPVIPIALAEESYAWLEQHFDRTSWANYAMPHAVCPDEINDISQILLNVLV